MSTSPTAGFPWFALYVKPRHEKNISRILRGKGYEEFLPLYARCSRSRKLELPLFPGYVFCRFNQHDRLPVLTVPGVFFIVGFAGAAAPVDADEISALKTVDSSGVPREPWPELACGERVTIKAGPLRGVEGVVTNAGGGERLILSVTLLQRAVAVQVDREWLA